MLFRLLIPGVCLALAGCAARVPPVPPSAGVDVPANWAQPSPPAQPDRGDLGAWWQGFGDPLLTSLIRDALSANTTVGAARANLMQARASRAEAAAALWPSVTGNAGARRDRGGAARSGSTFDVGADLSWEADLFGANRHGVAAQDALVRAGEASLGAAQVAVAGEVGLAYLELRNAQTRAAIARENLASQEETLQISRWREQAGLANAIEVQQALGAAEQTRSQLPLLLAGASQSAHALAVLTGRPPGELLQRLSVPAPMPQARAGMDTGVPAAALRRRPDVLAAEQRLRAAAEQVASADAARRPAVRLAASLAWSAGTLGGIGSVAAARSVVASLGQPLFDGGQLDARLRAREAEFESAQQGYRASVLQALQEVEDALATIATGRDRLAALQVALEAARLAALLATQRHAGGLIDFQTVLETQRNLLNVQDAVALAQAQLAQGQVRLYRALGGGWQPGAALQAERAS